MIRHVGEGRLVNFRVRPCCLCCLCPKGTIFNKNKIKLLRGAVYQVYTVTETYLCIEIDVKNHWPRKKFF